MSGFNLLPVFGGGTISQGNFATPEQIATLYDTLLANGCHNIDTARLYGESEATMGKTGAGQKFVIDTKAPGGFFPGTATGEEILKHARESIQKLGVKQVDVYYIHVPDPTLDLEDMLSGIQNAYKEGLFQRFGLSNFVAADVERVYNICKEKGWVLPTVYQGNYSVVSRRQETALFPTLRKLSISFYVYSPIAGGFLTKTKSQITEGKDAGRFTHNHPIAELYRGLYVRPAMLDALQMWEDAAKEAGVSRAEMAYRWVAFDSPLDKKYGDAIIFGASKMEQVSETLDWLTKGKLPSSAVEAIEKIWKSIEHEAPLDNFHP